MKRFLMIMTIFFLTILLVGCANVVTLDNPEPELFSVFHEGDNYIIFIRTEIDPDQLYDSMGYYIKGPKGYSCLVGAYEKVNYIVLYNDEYYDIINGAQMNLYTTQELIDWGVNVGCKLD
ncbi:MAG: hypothetical protein PHC62_06095 [Candidatus Izemoplasmatales bacterium]|jgi:hypothetical protein|nr:hypothetical protein [Candidatus Izemoplasmatales bacterium]